MLTEEQQAVHEEMLKLLFAGEDLMFNRLMISCIHGEKGWKPTPEFWNYHKESDPPWRVLLAGVLFSSGGSYVLERFLKAGADPNLRLSDGRICAWRLTYPEQFDVLFAAGFDIFQQGPIRAAWGKPIGTYLDSLTRRLYMDSLSTTAKDDWPRWSAIIRKLVISGVPYDADEYSCRKLIDEAFPTRRLHVPYGWWLSWKALKPGGEVKLPRVLASRELRK